MFNRICRSVTVAAGCLLTLIGGLTCDGATLIALSLLSLIIGGSAAAYAASARSSSAGSAGPQDDWGHPVTMVVAVSVAALLTGLAVAGLIALAGELTIPVLALLGIAGGVWQWRQRRTWHRHLHTSMNATRPQDRSTTIETAPPVAAAPAPVAIDIQPGSASVRQLCVAWQHSHWLLTELPTGPALARMVELRQHILDELDRRDPVGFSQWLDTGPRASGNPGRHMRVDPTPPSGRTPERDSR